MFHLPCFLCREEVACGSGDLGQMRKHIRGEHDTVKYRVEGVIALGFINSGKQEGLVEATKGRLGGFQNAGSVDNSGNIFGKKHVNNATEEQKDVNKNR